MKKSSFLLKVLSCPEENIETIAAKFPDFYYVAMAAYGLIGTLFSSKDILRCDVDGDDDLLKGTITLVLNLKSKEGRKITDHLDKRSRGNSFGVDGDEYGFKVDGRDNVVYLHYKYMNG